MLYDKLEYSHFETEIKNPVWEKVDLNVKIALFCYNLCKLKVYFDMDQDTANFSKCGLKKSKKKNHKRLGIC